MHLLFTAIVLVLGIVCLLRPVFLLFFLFAIPVISSFPGLTLEQSYLKVLQVGTISIYASDFVTVLMLLLLAILVIKNTWLQKQPLRYLWESPLSKMVVVMFLWDIFIAFLSLQKGFQFQNVIRKLSVEALMFAVLLIPLMDNIDRMRDRLFKFSLVLGLFLGFFGVVKYFILHEIEITSSGTLRSLLGNDVVVLLFPVCYMLFYNNFWSRKKAFTFIMLLFLSFGIHLTGHRSGYLSLLFVLTFTYFINIKEKLRYLWVPAFGAFTLGTMLFIPLIIHIGPDQGLAQDMIVRFNDTFNLENKTTVERLSYWKYVDKVFKASPLIGLGRFSAYGAEREYNSGYPSVMTEGPGGVVRPAHNFLVDKFIHQGFLGLGLLIAFILVLLKQIFKANQLNLPYAGFLTVYISAFLVFSLFNTPFSSYPVIFFYTAVGFLNYDLMHYPRLGKRTV